MEGKKVDFALPSSLLHLHLHLHLHTLRQYPLPAGAAPLELTQNPG